MRGTGGYYSWGGEQWEDVATENGYLYPGAAVSNWDDSPAPRDLPDPASANNVLAPFWTDLDSGEGRLFRIQYTAYDLSQPICDQAGYRIYTWDLVERESRTPRRFQLWLRLRATGCPPTPEEVYFVYDHSTMQEPAGQPFRVGAEDGTGTFGVMLPEGQLPTSNYRVVRDIEQETTPGVFWEVTFEGGVAGSPEVVASVSSAALTEPLSVSSVVTVAAEAAPVVVTDPQNVSAVPGEQVTFTASATGSTGVPSLAAVG